MNCQQAQDLLYQAECPADADDSSALAGHLAACADCRRLAGELAQLEESWRSMPLPEEADQARLAFLEWMPQQKPVALPQPGHPLARFAPSRWALAASILFVAGLCVWLFVSPSQVQAAPDVVDRLVDMNLDLAQASPDERPAMYSRLAPPLKDALEQSKLPPEDRDLAESLLANGSWLAENADPLAEADRFNDVADKVMERLRAATAKADVKAAHRLARHFHRIAVVGIDGNLERVQTAGPLNLEKQKRLERVAQRDAKRREALAVLAEVAPDASRKEIKKALADAAKQHKKEKKHAPVHEKIE
jgi:hypothetical protein